MDAGHHEPRPHAAPSSAGLSAAELAAEASVELGYVERLVQAGALRPDATGRHEIREVLQIRLVRALEEGGIELGDLTWAIRDAGMPLDRVADMWRVAESSARTYAEFASSLGERARLLPAVYAAFGLAEPQPGTIVRKDEEAVLASFLEVWGMVEDRPDVYARAAHIAGEDPRRLESATFDLFDELGGPPPSRLQRGLSPDEAMMPSV